MYGIWTIFLFYHTQTLVHFFLKQPCYAAQNSSCSIEPPAYERDVCINFAVV